MGSKLQNKGREKKYFSHSADGRTFEIIDKTKVNYKIYHDGFIKRDTGNTRKDNIAPVFSGVYSWSDAALRKVRQSEFALHALAELLQLPVHMFTLTFPHSFDNGYRWSCNDRWRKLVRVKKQFKAGIWVAEAHTGKGDASMKGLIHFHYKVICDKNFLVIPWLQKQQMIDRVKINSYDFASSDTPKMYQGLEVSKRLQKEVTHTGRIWGSWKLDRTPMVVSQEQISLFDPGTAIKLVDKVTGEIKPVPMGIVSGRKDIGLIIQKSKRQ